MRLLTNFIKDMRVSFKTMYIYMEIIMALIIVAVLLFVVPENFSASSRAYVYLDPALGQAPIVQEIDSIAVDNLVRVDNRSDIAARLEEDRNAIGLAIYIEGGRPVFDITLQGYESEKFRNIIETALTLHMAEAMPGYVSSVSTVTLDQNSERLSDRLNILPVFLVINAAFMGLFIIAAYIFIDKDEGTIKAFVVTPARMWEYLLSKVGVILVTGLVTGLLTTVLVAGTKPNYLHLAVLLFAGNTFGSAVGLFIASFYDNIMNSMGALYSTIIIFGLAATSYFMPAFSPLAIRLLPSYPMLFAFREAFLASPDVGYIYQSAALFIVLGTVFFLMANARFRKTLTA